MSTVVFKVENFGAVGMRKSSVHNLISHIYWNYYYGKTINKYFSTDKVDLFEVGETSVNLTKIEVIC